MKLVLISMLIFSSCALSSRKPSSTQSVLYIGDSQSEGYLGGIIYEHLKKVSQVPKIKLIGVGSSSPRHWGDNRSSKNSKWLCKRSGRLNNKSAVKMKKVICDYSDQKPIFTKLNENNPDLVIFQFLGNSMGFNESYISKKIGNLLGALADSQQCLFITSPPYYKDLVEKNKLRIKTQDYFVKAIGNRCTIIKGVTEETLKDYAFKRENFLGDRIHLSKKGALAFFDMIKQDLP